MAAYNYAYDMYMRYVQRSVFNQDAGSSAMSTISTSVDILTISCLAQSYLFLSLPSLKHAPLLVCEKPSWYLPTNLHTYCR